MTTTTDTTTPEILNHTIDVDAHEMAPTHLWGEMFGPTSAKLAIAAAFLR